MINTKKFQKLRLQSHILILKFTSYWSEITIIVYQKMSADESSVIYRSTQCKENRKEHGKENSSFKDYFDNFL